MFLFSRFTWIERSKYMFGSWPFFMMKTCDFVNSSNARHGNCIPWLSFLHDPTAPHTNKQRIKAVLVIHRASRLGRKGISDYALTRTEPAEEVCDLNLSRPSYFWRRLAAKGANTQSHIYLAAPKRWCGWFFWRFQDLWHGGFRLQDYFHVFSSIWCRSLMVFI